MSLQFIIDGYNIIHHPIVTRHTPKKVKDSRITLLDFIKTNRLCGSPKNKITVVFDGYSDLSGSREGLDVINVVFSRKETADAKIKRMVEESGNPKNIVVVSDDKEIKFLVKSLGAQWVSVEEFISRKVKPKDKKEDLLESELTYSQINQINRELRKIWLKE